MPPTGLIPRDPPLVTVRATPGDTPTSSALDATFPGVAIEPLYDAAQLAVLATFVARAQGLTPRYVPPRFADMYRVNLPPRADWTAGAPTTDLAVELGTLFLDELPIDHASVETTIAPLPLKDGAGNANDLLHLDPAPAGVDAEALWGLPDGRGQGEVLCDVERGWHTGHVEFNGIAFTLLPGSAHEDSHVPHGTRVLGTAVGRENGQFGMGVAKEVSTVTLSSEYRAAPSAPDTHAAVFEALKDLVNSRPVGSVMLLELQKNAKDFNSTVVDGLLGPCEMALEVFDLIQLATALHIVVVEAAGHGGSHDGTLGVGLNLDNHPMLHHHGDSGAILVGQSKWSGVHVAVDHGVIGKRIDCFSHGFDVPTASASPFGTNANNSTHFKDIGTSAFGGTSAAAAIIAGAALVVQGLVRRGAGGVFGYLPPMQMRMLLGSRELGFNTALSGGDTDTIGVQPNLQHIGAALGSLPDLYIRDNIGDNGGPHAGMLSQSPDIILVDGLPIGAVDKDDAYGELSGTKLSLDLSKDLVAGQTKAEIYVRVQNRGGLDVEGATVKVHYAKPTALVLPSSWVDIGTATIDVPAGDTLAVAGPIQWTNLPAVGHYCLVATVEHEHDPLFVPNAFADLQAYKHHVRSENNVAWRNFNVVNVPASGEFDMEAEIAGAEPGDPEGEDMEMQVDAQLPRGAQLEIVLSAKDRQRLTLPEGPMRDDARPALLVSGITRLGSLRLRPKDRVTIRLRGSLPPLKDKEPPLPHEVALIQLHEGQPVGRVTWRLTREARPSA